jgi:hypothetical protein
MSFNDFQPTANGGMNTSQRRTSTTNTNNSTSAKSSNSTTANGTVFSSNLMNGISNQLGVNNTTLTVETLARQLQDYQQRLTAFMQRLSEHKKRRGGISAAEKKE